MIYGLKKENMINTNLTKMKTRLTVLLVTLSTIFAFAQTEEKCKEDLQLYSQFAKNKSYDEAYPYFLSLRQNCPKQSRAIYQYGEFVIKHKIENAATPEEKVTQVRDLIKMFDEYDANFPGNNSGTTLKKAMALALNKVGTNDEIYGLLDNAFKNDAANFNNPQAIMLYFQLYVEDYKAANKGITLQQVFDKYDEISEKLELEEKLLSDKLDELLNKEEAGQTLDDKEASAKKRSEINLVAFSTVKGSMDAHIELLSTCEKLIPFYQKSYEEKKNDVQWLKRTAERLEGKECDTDPLFAKITEQLHQLNPTAESAYLLGVTAQRAKNTTKALEYFNQAAGLFTDATKKAKVYYKIATMYGSGNKVQARDYARKALAAKPSFGQSYLLIAQLVASSTGSCGNTPFEKRALNWLAARYANKAAAVDPALKATANRAAASYNGAAPSKSDIFSEGMAGKTISFGCWIGESVSVPNL